MLWPGTRRKAAGRCQPALWPRAAAGSPGSRGGSAEDGGDVRTPQWRGRGEGRGGSLQCPHRLAPDTGPSPLSPTSRAPGRNRDQLCLSGIWGDAAVQGVMELPRPGALTECPSSGHGIGGGALSSSLRFSSFPRRGWLSPPSGLPTGGLYCTLRLKGGGPSQRPEHGEAWPLGWADLPGVIHSRGFLVQTGAGVQLRGWARLSPLHPGLPPPSRRHRHHSCG